MNQGIEYLESNKLKQLIKVNAIPQIFRRIINIINKNVQKNITNLEAASSKLLIVNPESAAQESISSLPPDINEARHCVAF